MKASFGLRRPYRFRIVGEHRLTIKPAMRHNEHAEINRCPERDYRKWGLV
jgi:hypothetical protein